MAHDNLYLRHIIVFTNHQLIFCKVEHFFPSAVSTMLELKMKLAKLLEMTGWIMTRINPDLAGYIY